MSDTLIAPSILAADFARLGDEVRAVAEAGADWIHVDVMDGRFVPNLTIGPVVVEKIRPHTNLPLDVHLMIKQPELLIPAFAKAGADIISVHPETTDIVKTIALIKGLGKKAGVVLNPNSPIDLALPVLDAVDLILVMSVEAGFGGQSFMPAVLPKMAELARLVKESGRNVALEMDGGINAETAILARGAGAQVLVAGTAVFGAKDYKQAIAGLRNG